MSQDTGHTYLDSHEVSGDVLLLDIDQEAADVMDAARAAGVGHAAKTLVKDGPLRLIILGFKAGSSLREHSAQGPLSIQVVSGTVGLETAGGSQVIEPGKTLVLGASIAHSVQASTDAVLLLTIAWPSQ